MEAVQLPQKMAGSELVVTAEGRIDWQSAFGKTVLGVASAAREQGIPTVVLAGSLGPGHERIYAVGVAGVFPIVDGPMTLQDALKRADVLLEKAAESVMRLWLAAGGRLRG